jgi:hypothetical protein
VRIAARSAPNRRNAPLFGLSLEDAADPTKKTMDGQRVYFVAESRCPSL